MAEDRGPELAAVLGVFIALSWLFVGLRGYVKGFITKSWAADDLLLIVSLIFFSSYAACSLSGIKYGTGRHITDIPKADVPKALYFWFLCELFYTITTVMIRLSIAVFLLRIAVKPLHRGIIYGTVVVVVTFSTFYLFLVTFQCHPVSFFWLQYAGEKGSCIDIAIVPNASIAHSAVSFTADWILGLLPVLLIYDLQMNFRTKVSVAGVLSLGLLAGIAAIIRVPYIKVLGLTDDFLFATTDVAIWSTIEPGLGIVAAGAVTLRPLFKNFYALTTRNKSTNHITGDKHSKFRNSSRFAQMQGSSQAQVSMGARQTQHTYKSSVASRSEDDSDDIQLRSDIGKSGVNGSTRQVDPFRDENDLEALRGQDGRWGGIQVQRTVEVSRAEKVNGDVDAQSISSVESPNTPWPRADKDMV